MHNPLVSIIIPVYNGSNYLSRAIDSALAQTYEFIEILVINDGSNDSGATESVALSYGEKIRYFSKENGGVSSALNFGIANMKGEWFSWLSHDDMYTPDKIKKQILRLYEEIDNGHIHPSKAIALSGTKFINKDGKPIKRYQKNIKKACYTGLEMLLEVFSGYYISGCALLLNKAVFDDVGLFSTSLKYMQDMEMWYRIMLTDCHFFYGEEKTVLSRVHSNQLTVTGKSFGKKDAEIVGRWLCSQLVGKYVHGEYLLEKYYYLAIKRNAIATAKLVEKELKREKKLTLRVSTIAGIKRIYAKLRPKLVDIFYKVVLGIKVKRNG